MAQPTDITLEPLTEQEGEKPLFTPPAEVIPEITPEQAAAQEFRSIVRQAMRLPEGFQPIHGHRGAQGRHPHHAGAGSL